MKAAYHFDADHEIYDGFYGFPINMKVLSILLAHRTINISSKIFHGDLLLMMYSMDTKTDGNRTISTFNKNKYIDLFSAWMNPENLIWRKFSNEKIKDAFNKNIHVLCFESIDQKTAEYINTELQSDPTYLGAMEVDDSSKIHWALYSESLIPFARIINKNLSLFYEHDDDKDHAYKEEFEKSGFNKVEFEALNGKYTIFDTYSNYEEARRIAEWKRNSGALLAFVSDEIVSKLSDIAPELGNKLWAALQTYEAAETNEQFAQVTASCRRIFEYVTDSIFPPSNEKIDGHSLKADKYKNRLIAYADKARQSDTNIDLVVATTATLFEQWDKLNNLSNKGVHGEIYRSETRRCLLRTIMLLDDIVSLKSSAFEIKPKLNFEDIFDTEK